VELETFLADKDVVLGSDLDMQSLQEGAGAQSSGSSLTAPALGLVEEDFEPTVAELAAFLADEEVMLEIQALPDLLGCPPARAGVAPFCMPPRAAQQLSGNVPPWKGRKPPAAMTPRQTALYLALQRLQLARTEVEIHRIVRALATALGASRTEQGTIRALHAVLIQMGRPSMSEEEAYNATGAKRPNFKNWQKRVQYRVRSARPATTVNTREAG
jgi:hypothetical protein